MGIRTKKGKRFFVMPKSHNEIELAKRMEFKNYLHHPSSELQHNKALISNEEFHHYLIDRGFIYESTQNKEGRSKKVIGIFREVSTSEEFNDFVREIEEYTNGEKILVTREDLFLVVVKIVGGWQVIPAENLVAISSGYVSDGVEGGRRVEVLMVVETVEDARVMLTALEVGVDGVVLENIDEEKLSECARMKTQFLFGSKSLESLSEMVVKSVRKVGMGDRVCVDTCSLLLENEGLLVGTAAGALTLVLSESVEFDYVPSRPFRVNAGPVASYVLCSNGRTRYLGELRAGDEVLVVDQDGRTRSVVVGRVKIESRPLMVVHAKNRQGEAKVVLQNAETVRLAKDKNQWISASELKEGDIVLTRIDRGTAARHMGIPVAEQVLER